MGDACSPQPDAPLLRVSPLPTSGPGATALLVGSGRDGVCHIEVEREHDPALSSSTGPAASCLAVDHSSGAVYAADSQTGSLVVWRRDAYHLQPVQDVGGLVGPCHLAVSDSARLLVVCDYAAGEVALFRLRHDGGVGPLTNRLRLVGSGPVVERQSMSHPHQAVLDAKGQLAWVTDLGGDALYTISIDRAAGTCTVVDHERLPPGSGPRHLAAGTAYLAVSAELGNCVLLRRRGPGAGPWTAVAGTRSSTTNYPGDVLVSGERAFVANRGADTIAAIDLETGTLAWEHHDHISWPQHLLINGGDLWVACRDGDSLVRLTDIHADQPRVTAVKSVPQPNWLLPAPWGQPRRAATHRGPVTSPATGTR